MGMRRRELTRKERGHFRLEFPKFEVVGEFKSLPKGGLGHMFTSFTSFLVLFFNFIQ